MGYGKELICFGGEAIGYYCTVLYEDVLYSYAVEDLKYEWGPRGRTLPEHCRGTGLATSRHPVSKI